MIIKGTKHIEDLANAREIAFDKTGTITTGKMKIDKFETLGNYSVDELLNYLYAIEKNSNHPISTAIKQKVEKESNFIEYNVDKYEEIAGCGIKAIVNNKKILFGNTKFLEENNLKENIQKNANYIIIDDKLEGFITFEEEVRTNCKQTIQKLKSLSLNEIVMLTGDNETNANKIAAQVGIEKIYYGLLPIEKQERVKKLKKKGKIIFVGDGINDSPVLAESDFGISMSEGSEIANNTADGILISNNLETLSKAIKISRKSMGIIKFNIIFSLIIKVIVLILGIIGIAPVWLAVVADTGVSLFTVVNSLRIFR
jgi:Cd2+/Zn2+-exporting ATPase